MNPKILLNTVIRPTLLMMGDRFKSPSAEAMLIAIAAQESGLEHRVQMDGGPAHGLWQFEMGGGVAGVMGHKSTKLIAESIATTLLYKFTRNEIYIGIINNDILACSFARLLLWSHPSPLPDPNDLNSSWQYYTSLWRPGKPHIERWPASVKLAVDAVGA